MNGTGDCFPVAIEVAKLLEGEGCDGVHVCHGRPVGQGKIAGIRHWHAWVEVRGDGPTMVFDRSNGKRICMLAETYYRVGRIEDVTAYPYVEALRELLKYRHYGPWSDEFPPLPDYDDEDEWPDERLEKIGRARCGWCAGVFGRDEIDKVSNACSECEDV